MPQFSEENEIDNEFILDILNYYYENIANSELFNNFWANYELNNLNNRKFTINLYYIKNKFLIMHQISLVYFQ